MVRDIRSAEYNKQKRKVLWIKLGIIFTLFLALGGLLIWLSGLKSIQIDTITISGATVLGSESLEGQIRRELVGKYLWAFPKTNVFLYPHARIEKSLLETFPRIKTVSLNTLDNHILSVSIVERQPFALWCDTPPTESLVSQCYFLDYDGFVFDHAPQFSGSAYFKYYGFLPFEAPIGSYYLSSTTGFHELSEFVESTERLGITPLYMSAVDADSFELFVFGGGKILLDTRESLSKVFDRFSALLKTPNLVPKQGGELLIEYIDLRFGNKMFFKPRE
jgi:hypothetical protein